MHPMISFFSHGNAIETIDLRQGQGKNHSRLPLFSLSDSSIASIAQHDTWTNHLLASANDRLLLLDVRHTRSPLAQVVYLSMYLCVYAHIIIIILYTFYRGF